MKQSSIDWIYNNLKSHFEHDGDLLETVKMSFEQAKAMHKEEHGQTWDKSMENFEARGRNEMRAWVDFDEYYNETFGGNNEQ